jgi:hypothetical protein
MNYIVILSRHHLPRYTLQQPCLKLLAINAENITSCNRQSTVAQESHYGYLSVVILKKRFYVVQK